MINSLRKVYFSHPSGNYTWEKIHPPPLEKILGAPLLNTVGMSQAVLQMCPHYGAAHTLPYVCWRGSSADRNDDNWHHRGEGFGEV